MCLTCFFKLCTLISIRFQQVNAVRLDKSFSCMKIIISTNLLYICSCVILQRILFYCRTHISCLLETNANPLFFCSDVICFCLNFSSEKKRRVYDQYGKDGLFANDRPRRPRHHEEEFDVFGGFPFIFRDPEDVFREFFGAFGGESRI